MFLKFDCVFFQSLDRASLTEICRGFTPVTFQKGDFLFKANTVFDCLYLVISGRVGVYHGDNLRDLIEERGQY